MYYILIIIFGLIGGIFRRIWGGGLKISKFLKILMMVILSAIIVYVKYNYFSFFLKTNLHLYLSCLSLWIINWGHGGFFTIMNETVRERKEPLKSIVRFICGDNEYKIIGNYTGLLIGYSFRCLIISYFIENYLYIIVGAIIAHTYLMYGLIWKIYFKDKSKEFIISHWWDYTHLAEFIWGFIASSLLFIMV